ncbi:hypothetical protein IPA_07730 [Ignicoccus pacificus DSM 13166]|uniref:Uncharacterized protein n=1 Tax=Ignicoccus pacificus DSM 13166 TaxID=940294 RepID=A0A977PL76_9CREN|nr:hypothetical protein IPA_07730 [Ignicoccus pacificus DSM 13166]
MSEEDPLWLVAIAAFVLVLTLVALLSALANLDYSINIMAREINDFKDQLSHQYRSISDDLGTIKKELSSTLKIVTKTLTKMITVTSAALKVVTVTKQMNLTTSIVTTLSKVVERVKTITLTKTLISWVTHETTTLITTMISTISTDVISERTIVVEPADPVTITVKTREVTERTITKTYSTTKTLMLTVTLTRTMIITTCPMQKEREEVNGFFMVVEQLSPGWALKIKCHGNVTVAIGESVYWYKESDEGKERVVIQNADEMLMCDGIYVTRNTAPQVLTLTVMAKGEGSLGITSLPPYSRSVIG